VRVSCPSDYEGKQHNRREGEGRVRKEGGSSALTSSGVGGNSYKKKDQRKQQLRRKKGDPFLGYIVRRLEDGNKPKRSP